MPGGDRTGPAGQGPRSGRGAGYCSGFDMPGFAQAGPGYGGAGWAGGRGGRGRRNRFYATGVTGRRCGAWDWHGQYYGRPYPAESFTASREQELNDLKVKAKYFQDALGNIQKRIQDLERSVSDGSA